MAWQCTACKEPRTYGNTSTLAGVPTQLFHLLMTDRNQQAGSLYAYGFLKKKRYVLTLGSVAQQMAAPPPRADLYSHTSTAADGELSFHTAADQPLAPHTRLPCCRAKLSLQRSISTNLI